VVEDTITIVSALDGVVAAGRHGRRTGDAGVIVCELPGMGLATLTARKDRRAALIDAVQKTFGVELPTAPRRVAGPDIAFIWSGPDQWLACRSSVPAAGMEALLAPACCSFASTVDQSHGRTLLRLRGLRLRDALAKGMTLDLHPRSFMPGFVAVTSIAHIGVHCWQTDEQPTYEFCVPRSLAISFWHWLTTAAAEYGLDLVGADP
jgi:methylglutamate dehydrogenase subunit D